MLSNSLSLGVQALLGFRIQGFIGFQGFRGLIGFRISLVCMVCGVYRFWG